MIRSVSKGSSHHTIKSLWTFLSVGLNFFPLGIVQSPGLGAGSRQRGESRLVGNVREDCPGGWLSAEEDMEAQGCIQVICAESHGWKGMALLSLIAKLWALSAPLAPRDF